MDYGRFDNYNKDKDKAVMFFSASSAKDAEMLLDCNIYEILTSYHYISKNFDRYENHILPTIKENRGLFMTDSGAFSFFHGEISDEFYTAKYWEPYIERYCAWLEENAKYIYCAANMDLDVFLGRERIDYWDKKYFKPLEKLLQVVYIAHGHSDPKYHDQYGTHRLEHHLRKHDYVGLGSSLMVKRKGFDSRFFQLARAYKGRIHAFGWTSMPRLNQYPFFSVDSTTWLGGVRYGTSYIYDGANFTTRDHKHKYMRVGDKVFCRDNGIDYEALVREERYAINQYNLTGWKGARNDFIKVANTKLWNKPTGFYAKIK